MTTLFIKSDPEDPDREVLETAGQIIKRGGLVAFPTETVYGLGGNALDETAAAKIYAAKGRPSDNPLIVHIADIRDLEKLTEKIPEKARILAKELWPGPLTMIFQKSPLVPKGTTGGLDTVAVRFPSHPIAAGMIQAAGGFVAAPSANLSGRPSTTKAEHVREDLDGRVDMILDGGASVIGLESTIVDMTVEPPAILRPGYYNVEIIESLIGEVIHETPLIKDDSASAPKAPGMKYRHYAPKGELLIVAGAPEKTAEKIKELIHQAEKAGKTAAVICAAEHKGLYPGIRTYVPGSLSEESQIAHALFDILRKLDEDGIGFACSEAFYTEKMGEAVMNRLCKAAGQRIIKIK